MDYDFPGICTTHLEKLEKKLHNIHKGLVKDYNFALDVINSPSVNSKRNEVTTELETLFFEHVSKSMIFYTETLNKVQRVLKKHL